MGDVLPPKRQTVVDRLRRRIELYRRHHNACLPRYEQTANGLYEHQRQDTLLLQQRYLEAKAKKAKKNDHRASKEPTPDTQKTVTQPKPLKRVAEESPITSAPEGPVEDQDHPVKVARLDNSTPDQAAQDTPTLPSFSVQIVQQFTNSNNSQAQHSQTIQTNVTVKALPSTTKACNSPLSTNQKEGIQPASRSIGTNVECKQEKEVGSDPCQCRSQTSSSGGDRLSDTFPSLGFTEDSGDDVIHPDILKDLIDDVFTNSTDIMKDFNFEDSVGSVKDQDDVDKDATEASIIDMVKDSSPQLRPFQTENLVFGNSQPTQPQATPVGLFENTSTSSNPTSTIMTVMATSAPPTSTTTTSTLYPPPSRLPSYNHSGAGLSISSGLGLDFKLTEPSPAALTLKQMAEQHQNMQQKQQQHQQQQQQQQQHMGLRMNTPHSRSQYGQDSFPDHMSLRSNFINGSGSHISPLPKGQTPAMYPPMGYDQRPGYPGIKQMGNLFKQEAGVCGAGIPHMSEVDVQKQNVHLQQMQGHSVQSQDHKLPVYNATRPLTHYPQPMGQSSIPVPHAAQYGTQSAPDMRLQMSQSQQMHMAHGNQQVQQVPASSPDLKQAQSAVQPHSNMYGGYPTQPVNSPMFHVAMSQSLTYTAQFGSTPGASRPPPEYKLQRTGMAPSNLTIVDHDAPPPHMVYYNPNKNNYPRVQRPPNVTVNPDGVIGQRSSDWNHHPLLHQQQQTPLRMTSYPRIAHQDEYNNLMGEGPTSSVMPRAIMHPQYRITGGQMTSGRLSRPHLFPANHLSMQQQMSMHPRSVNQPVSSTGVDMQVGSTLSLGSSSGNQMDSQEQMYPHPDPTARQDGSHINLDFLDIESSASDLLNFEQVMQGSGSHFPLLDDMEMLSK